MKLVYYEITSSTLWQLMPWSLASPGNQQPWYWICRINKCLSSTRTDFNYLCLQCVEKWQIMWLYFYIFLTHCSLMTDIWWYRSGSTLAQVMACCLTAPSHYLNQYWILINSFPTRTPFMPNWKALTKKLTSGMPKMSKSHDRPVCAYLMR